MSVVLHISDTHFGTELPPVVDALVALAAQQHPDLVVLSGDITQRARPSQFRAAKAFVDRLGAPLLAVPGNHDIALFDLWSRLTSPYARYTKAFGGNLEPVHASSDLLVIGVNTTRAWRHKNGEVSSVQIERVAKLLNAASPQQLRLVVVHQPALQSLPLYLYLNSRHAALVPKFADALRAMKQDGTYARLRAVKDRYDPDGLFFVHHGVGSEDWSPDGFTRRR